MLVVIREGNKISLKMSFILHALNLNSSHKVLYVSRKGLDKSGEEWGSDGICLATLPSAILANYLLMILKNPGDLRSGLASRLFGRQRAHVLFNEGFFSTLSLALHYYFATRA